MTELKTGGNLGELKKTIEKNRSEWKQIVATKQQEWQKKLKEKSDEMIVLNSKSTSKETELLTQVHKIDGDISAMDFEKNNLITKKNKLKEDLMFIQNERKKQKEKLHESTVITMRGEVVRRQEEVNKKFRENEMKCEISKLHIQELESQVTELTNRLADDKKRWQEVVRMKGDDFVSLRDELVNKVKMSQSEYKEEEKEVQTMKGIHQDVENKVKEKERQFREREAKWRDQLTSMENEINKLKREFESKVKIHQKEILTREKDLEALQKEMDRFIEELAGGVGVKFESKSTEIKEDKVKEKVEKKVEEQAVQKEIPVLEEPKFIASVVSVPEKTKLVDENSEVKTEETPIKRSFWSKLLGK
ncbi:MAG: hypothetical protein PHE88_08795 [Elusimicrobia bacterium]|nr:hypothetical protein [Elusimicrobiota bacterium]